MEEKMTGTGIFITEEERHNLETEFNCSGMFLSGGMPMGQPEQYAQTLKEKYNPPEGAGINLKTGEWMLP
jgi:hypothetical protein